MRSKTTIRQRRILILDIRNCGEDRMIILKKGQVMKLRKSIIPVGFLVLIPLFLFALSGLGFFVNKKLKRVEEDWDMLLKAFNSYGLDRCGMYFPPDTVERRKEDRNFPLTFELSPEFIKSRPVNYDNKPVEHWIPLTTPVAYAAKIPKDPFRPDHFYGYSCWNWHDHLYPMAFFHSPGPDEEDDISPLKLRKEINTYLRSRGTYHNLFPEEYGIFKSMIIPYLYDPTNGAGSSGDLIWLLDYTCQVYGWRKQDVKQWMDAPLPELPLYTSGENSGIQGDWDVGDTLPPPRSMVESSHRKKTITVPDTLYSVMRFTNYLKSIPDIGYRLDLEALSGVQNQFGRYFSVFFETPRPLSSEEMKRLKSWQESQSAWWRHMDLFMINKSTSYNSLPAHEVYVFLPLFGKSQILLAACEAAEGDMDKALKRIEALEVCLNKIMESKKDYKGESDPYEESVETELNRLCLELKNTLKL